ncbi:unnamed protein product, partial [Larinioides sclopetarius]
MSVQPLYKLCLQRTVFLMRTERWITFSSNPFSNLPSVVIDDLMVCLTSRRFRRGEINFRIVKKRLGEYFLLLTSGKLTHLCLKPFELRQEYEIFLEII